MSAASPTAAPAAAAGPTRLAWRRRGGSWRAQLVGLAALVQQAPSGRFVWDVPAGGRCGEADTLTDAKHAAETRIAEMIGWQAL